MDSGLIAGRYAKALFLSALDNEVIDDVYRDMQLIDQRMKQEPRIGVHLAGPTLSKNEKRELLKNTHPEASAHTSLFFSLLIDKHRETKLQAIAMLYIELYRKQKNITTVGIETVVPIDAMLESKIIQMVSNKTHGEVEVINRINPGLLGGYIVYVDDYRLDKSIATELKRLKKGQENCSL